ncbi:MAG: citramalate synthase [Coriobacteriales bacterium]|nr:citramalate synthase [Coriobacteriales bacterium]
MAKRILIYDTTLRDGEQREGVALTVKDKLRLVQRLDALGIDYIEGGFPASNPKDAEFYQLASQLELKHVRLVAFGTTCHQDSPAELDDGRRTLAACPVACVTLVGKASMRHVQEVLQTSPQENLRMVADSIAYLKAQGKQRVFLDVEHFFDGYLEDPIYAFNVLDTAAKAGASALVLCETNGGRMPHEIFRITKLVCEAFPQIQVGIHTHDDCGCAVANSLEAVRAGATQVQGTINGYGERVGNADLVTIIPTLELKYGYETIGAAGMRQLTAVSLFTAELFNIAPNSHHPYVGTSAFAHKGGLHTSANQRFDGAYEHTHPSYVGNLSRAVVSELSGKPALVSKAAELGVDISRDPELTDHILAVIKERERRGYSYEVADASLAMLLRHEKGLWQPHFTLESFRVIIDKRNDDGEALSEATIKIHVGNERFVATGEGNGPVNALDVALRKAITEYYPVIKTIELTDFKVRVLDESQGTDAVTRVLIESSDGTETWNTIGVSDNIIAASWEALVDAVEYCLYRTETKGE